VDGPEALADRRLERALQRDARALDGVERRVRNRIAVFRDGGHARGLHVPLDVRAGGFEDANGGGGDGRADAVAGDQGDGNAHGAIKRSATRSAALLRASTGVCADTPDTSPTQRASANRGSSSTSRTTARPPAPSRSKCRSAGSRTKRASSWSAIIVRSCDDSGSPYRAPALNAMERTCSTAS